MLISISLIGSGTVVTSYEGFALDSNENLYLGEYSKINVYKEGSCYILLTRTHQEPMLSLFKMMKF